MRIVSTALLLGCARPSAGTDRFLDTLEKGIQMPSGSKPLQEYSRSYFYLEGGKKVMGVLTTLRSPGRRWVARNPGPFMADGGCAIITVVIDAASQRVEQVECNGVG
jgi:hypothetical protein